MARLVKCKYCGEQKNIDDAYKKVVYGPKSGNASNVYFCNVEHCQEYDAEENRKAEEKEAKKAERLKLKEEEKQRVLKIKQEKEERRQLRQEEKRKDIEKRKAEKDKAYYLICEIVGRKEIINTALWKEWAIWNKVAGNKILGEYLEENKDYLISVVSRLPDVEFNRIRYLSSIIKNNLGDYKPRVKETEKIIPVIQEEHYETKFKNKKKRKGFEALEEEFDE
jgi:hypothetical protein